MAAQAGPSNWARGGESVLAGNAFTGEDANVQPAETEGTAVIEIPAPPAGWWKGSLYLLVWVLLLCLSVCNFLHLSNLMSCPLTPMTPFREITIPWAVGLVNSESMGYVHEYILIAFVFFILKYVFRRYVDALARRFWTFGCSRFRAFDFGRFRSFDFGRFRAFGLYRGMQLIFTSLLARKTCLFIYISVLFISQQNLPAVKYLGITTALKRHFQREYCENPLLPLFQRLDYPLCGVTVFDIYHNRDFYHLPWKQHTMDLIYGDLTGAHLGDSVEWYPHHTLIFRFLSTTLYFRLFPLFPWVSRTLPPAVFTLCASTAPAQLGFFIFMFLRLMLHILPTLLFVKIPISIMKAIQYPFRRLCRGSTRKRVVWAAIVYVAMVTILDSFIGRIFLRYEYEWHVQGSYAQYKIAFWVGWTLFISLGWLIWSQNWHVNVTFGGNAAAAEFFRWRWTDHFQPIIAFYDGLFRSEEKTRRRRATTHPAYMSGFNVSMWICSTLSTVCLPIFWTVEVTILVGWCRRVALWILTGDPTLKSLMNDRTIPGAVLAIVTTYVVREVLFTGKRDQYNYVLFDEPMPERRERFQID